MRAQRGSQRKRQPAKSDKKAASKETEPKSKTRGLTSPSDREDQADVLASLREALKTARAELKEEHSARLAAERAKTQAEEALREARHQTLVEPANAGKLPKPPSASGAEHVSPKSRASLLLCDVRVRGVENPASPTLTLQPSEPFTVEASFELRGPNASSVAEARAFYEIRLYVHDLARGTSKWLATERGRLTDGVYDYTNELDAPGGLRSGAYRLVTVLALRKPTPTAVHHEGPVLDVLEVQKLASPNQGATQQIPAREGAGHGIP